MSMESRRQSSVGSDPWRMLGVAAVGLVCLLFALPGLVLGLVLSRFKGTSRWSLLCWLLIAFACVGLFAWLYQHGLRLLFMQQFGDVVFAVKHHQGDVMHWNLPHLWSDTWPVWIRTLLVAPVVVFWKRVDAETKGSLGVSVFQRQQQQRQRRITRSQHVARRRTQRPEQVPDEIDGVLVMGVPLDDDPIS
jgi:hypothetical protein